MSDLSTSPATNSWPSLLRMVASLLLAYALLMVGNTLSNTQTSLSLLALGLPVKVAGLVQSAYYAGFFLGGFFCGTIVHRYGHHRTFAALAAVICAVVLGQALVESPWLWGLARFVNGLAVVGIFMVVESWLNGTVSNERRGQLFSVYLIIGYIGSSAGQWLLKLPLSQPNWQFILVAMLFALSVIPVTLTSQRPLVLAAPPSGRVFSRALRTLILLKRRSPLGLYGAFVSGCFNSAFYSMMPVVLSKLHYGTQSIGNFMGLVLLAAPVLQWPMGKWADGSNRSVLLMRCTLVVLVLSLLLMFLLNIEWLFLPLVLLYIGIAFTFYGTLNGIANDAMPPRSRVEVSAALLMVYALGGILGPSLCAMVMDIKGPEGYFAVSVLLSALLAGYAYWTVRCQQQRESR